MSEKTTAADVLSELTACCEALEDKKAEDLRILHLGDISSITDYYVIATGNSAPHLKALKKGIEDALKQKGIKLGGIQEDSASGWLVVDAYDFMVHLFLPEQREHYALEALWKDAQEVRREELLSA